MTNRSNVGGNKITLDDDQLEAVRFIASQAPHPAPTASTATNQPGGALNASQLGQGKTAVSVAVVQELQARTVLVIAPLHTEDGWRGAVQNLRRLPFYKIDSKPDNLENFSHLKKGRPGFYFVGREFFALSGTSTSKAKTKNPRKARWNWATVNKNLDIAILDEGHSVSNRYSTGYTALKQVNPKLLKMYLSATPFRSDFGRAWAPTRWLWPDLIDRSQARWGAQWAKYGYNEHKRSKNKMEIIGELNPGAFVRSLPCYVRLTYKPKPVELHRVRSALTSAQEQQYLQMLNHSIAWLEENPLVAELPIVQKIRLRQMLLGEVTIIDNEVTFSFDCASDKIRQCIAIAERYRDKQIMFYTDSRKFAKVLAKRLTDAGQPSVAWTGGLSKAKRNSAKAAFLGYGSTSATPATPATAATAATSTVKHIVAVAAAIGEGTDGLQWVSHTEVWVNMPFDSVIIEQTQGRLNRRGQPHEKIIRYQLIVPGTVDKDDIVRDLDKTAQRLAQLT